MTRQEFISICKAFISIKIFSKDFQIHSFTIKHSSEALRCPPISTLSKIYHPVLEWKKQNMYPAMEPKMLIIYSVLELPLLLKEQYCIASYRIVSYRIVSYRIVSYRIVSYRIVSYRIALHCTALDSILFYSILLHCTALHCTELYCTVLNCIELNCIVLYCIVLYCIVLYCTVLYCIVLEKKTIFMLHLVNQMILRFSFSSTMFTAISLNYDICSTFQD